MPLIVDSHNDIAWNMLAYRRDYTRPVEETRRLEAGTRIRELADDALLGWPEYQRGSVAVVFATLYAPPMRFAPQRTGNAVGLSHLGRGQPRCTASS